MKRIEFDDIYLEWHSEGRIQLIEDGEPYDYTHIYDGKIIYLEYGDSGDSDPEDRLIGGFRFTIVNASAAINSGLDLMDVFDTDSDTWEVFEGLYDNKSRDLKESIEEILDFDFLSHNVLIINRLGIVPEFRGQSIGLLVLRRILEQFSDMVGLIALHPAPFEFSETTLQSGDWWHTEPNEDEMAVQKLRTYYRRLGCLDITDTPIMVINPSTRLPSIELLKTKKSS